MTIKQKYLKYLFASFGSALIMSIYSLVDTICVGQYHGETGTAALAITLPLWTIIFSLGLLFGIGGAALRTSFKAEKDEKRANQYYTLSVMAIIIVVVLIWIIINIFYKQILIFFGADNDTLFDLASKYVFWMRIGLPCFMFSPFLSGFIRNDNAPLKATIATIAGGVFNVVGDLLFVFVFDMGISGAGLATMIGQGVMGLILFSHYFSKKNTLHFTKVNNVLAKLKDIIIIGLPSFVLDISLGIITITFNKQIVNYLDGNNETATLAIFGVACNVLALVQSMGYAVGQAGQPLISESYGKSEIKEIRSYLYYGTITSIIVGVLVTILLLINPNAILNIFINTTGNNLVLQIAPGILRKYFLNFLFIIFNINAIYYFQATLRGGTAFLLSILKGFVLPISFLFIIPLINFDYIWYTLLFEEAIVAILSAFFILKLKLKYIE